MCIKSKRYRGIIGYPSPYYNRYNSMGTPPIFSAKTRVFTGGVGCYNYVKTGWIAVPRTPARRTHIAMMIFFPIGLRHLAYTACNVYPLLTITPLLTPLLIVLRVANSPVTNNAILVLIVDNH